MIKYKGKDVKLVAWLSKDMEIVQIELLSGSEKGMRKSCYANELEGSSVKKELKGIEHEKR